METMPTKKRKNKMRTADIGRDDYCEVCNKSIRFHTKVKCVPVEKPKVVIEEAPVEEPKEVKPKAKEVKPTKKPKKKTTPKKKAAKKA